MRVRTLVITALATVAALSSAAPASAQQSPNPCNANRLHLDLVRDHSLVRNGDVINYKLEVDNIGDAACDVSNINIKLQLPGPDGNPSPVVQSITVASAYPAQMPKITFGPFAYTVNANPGVTRLVARTTVTDGELHDGETFSDVDIDKTIGSDVMRPAITIDKVGSTAGPLPAPQDVTYTFYVKNGTLPAGADSALSNVTVTDDKCGSPAPVLSPLGLNVGDADGDKKLDTNETFSFTCTLTHPAPGRYTNTAVANGENILYGRSVPVVSPPDTWTVVLVAPPANPPANPPAGPPAAPAAPQGAVKDAAVVQAPCTMSTAKSLTVRAGQLNTIKVTLSRGGANKLVRITLPGGKVVSAKTNSSGAATIQVRPTRSGTATIRSEACTTARVAVRAARKVAAQRLPRVTG
jgi:hypothetical protein